MYVKEPIKSDNSSVITEISFNGIQWDRAREIIFNGAVIDTASHYILIDFQC